MRRVSVWLGLGMVAAMAVACGGSGDDKGNTSGSASSEGKAKSCKQLCEAAAACDASADDCETSCRENESVSNAGQQALSTCFSKLSCEPSEGDLFSAFLCLTDELEDTKLSQEQKKFCSTTSRRVQACTGSKPDNTLGDCEAQIGFVSDDVLSEVNSCDDKDCDALQSCVSLQLLQGLNVSELGDVAEGGEINSGVLGDLLAALVVGSQLGLDEATLPGAGGAFP